MIEKSKKKIDYYSHLNKRIGQPCPNRFLLLLLFYGRLLWLYVCLKIHTLDVRSNYFHNTIVAPRYTTANLVKIKMFHTNVHV